MLHAYRLLWRPLTAVLLVFPFVTLTAISQTPQPIEPTPGSGTVVFVGDVGVRIREDSGTLPEGCSPEEVVHLLTAFLDAFNRGDQQALAQFFPDEASQRGPLGVDASEEAEGEFKWYSVGGAPGSFNPGFQADNRDELLSYFVERHAQGERMELLQVDYGTDLWWENGTRGIDMTYDIMRQADDIPTHIAGGKGAIDCREQTIYVWSMGDREGLPDRNFATPAATPASVTAAQTPVVPSSGGEWWTAWSACPITPVQVGSAPENIPGMAEDMFWLQAETTNASDIDMIVWLWTGNRPLPLHGQYASDGTSTKWLWAFSEEMQEISATVTSETGAEGEVNFAGEIISSSTGPINGWPSGIILPEPGCWTFDITATALDGDVYEGRLVFPAVP